MGWRKQVRKCSPCAYAFAKGMSQQRPKHLQCTLLPGVFLGALTTFVESDTNHFLEVIFIDHFCICVLHAFSFAILSGVVHCWPSWYLQASKALCSIKSAASPKK